MPFVDTNSHLTAKPYNFDIKFQRSSESYDQHFFGDKFFVGVSIFFLRLKVFNEREYSEADWLVPLILNTLNIKVYLVYKKYNMKKSTKQY